MRPEKNYRNTEGAFEALVRHLDVVEFTPEILLLGHSFGTGAALQFAERRRVARIVLVAPYNTLKKALYRRLGPLAWLVPSQIDNGRIIRGLLSRPVPPEIVIFHGENDDSLPISMGKELARIDGERIVFHEISGGGHSDILTTRRDLIFRRLLGQR